MTPARVAAAALAVCCLLQFIVGSHSHAAPSLTVHLVCHTHDDVGWQVTVDEYYDREVHNIIDTVVSGLAANPERKFMYVEQAFFQRWWRRQGSEQRSLAQRLVASGQLEFVNGGWCMHDEASTHYVDMVDQTALGHRYISQQFGVQPTVTWQIDPFGHSASQAALFGPLSGIDAVFFARIDYQDKTIRQREKTLEMLWRSSPSLGETAQTFAGAFANGFGYGAPAGFCWDQYECRQQPQVQDNSSAPGYNLDAFVNSFVETAQRQANVSQGTNLMWTLGNDFAYQNASSWFVNLDKLIKGVNADGRVRTLYSTPSIYLKARHDEDLTWTVKTDDFFPYADGPDSYWTGYFTSRAALKRYVRFTSAVLQATRHLEVFSGADGSDSQTLWEAQGVAQHHDGVSGTAKQAVTFDYAQRLSVGYDLADKFIGRTLGSLVTGSGQPPALRSCPLTNVSVCSVTQSGSDVVVILYNQLARRLWQLVTVPWPSSDAVVVLDGTGETVPSQQTATMPNIARDASSAAYQVQFVAAMPGLGYSTYFITKPSAADAQLPASSRAAAIAVRPARSLLSVQAPSDVSIRNEFWQLSFDSSTGLLASVTNVSSGAVHRLSQTFLWYAAWQQGGQNSGAYILRPDQSNATATPVATKVSNVSVVEGDVSSEVRQVFAPWLTQIVRLTAMSPVIQFEWTVGHIPVDDGQGKEIIVRYSSDIASNAAFYTDSNGRELQRRVRNQRPSWQWQPTEIVAGNYYPCNVMGALADRELGMAVVTDRSQGCSSLADGSLEFLIHRRLLHDDGRGVGEPLNEPGTDGQGLTVTGTHDLVLAPPSHLAAAARHRASTVYAAAYAAFAPLTQSVPDYLSSHNVSGSFLRTPLPWNVELMTMQVSDAAQSVCLLRLAHQFGEREDAHLSQPVTVDLSSLFTRPITAVTELTLTGNQALGAHKGYQWKTQSSSGSPPSPAPQLLRPFSARIGSSFNITLTPAAIRTFNVTLG